KYLLLVQEQTIQMDWTQITTPQPVEAATDTLHMQRITQYVLKICYRHEFENPVLDIRSTTPFAAIATGDYIKLKETDERHPGAAFTHRITGIYHYTHPEGRTLTHVLKLTVEKSQDPNQM